MEMINLKPSFAKKLNPNGFSPMLLALRSAQTKLVLRLLKTDKDLVRVKGWEGMTPFHYVVTTGNSRLLINFLEACPECIEDVTVRDETALHLALKEDQNEAFNLLIGWLQRTRSTHGSVFSFEKKMANWKDDQDNSLLHIAAKKKQHEALRLVVRFPTLVTRKSQGFERFDGSRNHKRC
ncbi:ankyrin repeat-containing protein BDA1-like [Hibiscus syriacus]|uniref:ankyrin repeat-containing protein BDA1-like n=1 Tax=Hibiscus syriacus TaxID=106335 RepID=UPI001924FC6C|nr:ankyrin repeat-containing protein BDA1-like [Hibiscus syriacus]